MKLKIIKDVLGNDYLAITDFNSMLNAFNDSLFNALLDYAKNNIKNFDLYNKNLLKRNGGNYHLTVFNVAECNKIPTILNLVDIKIDDLIIKGIGAISKNDNTTFFIVCDSKTITKIRYAFDIDKGLDSKDLHITIGFNNKDLFHDRKNVCNIVSINNFL